MSPDVAASIKARLLAEAKRRDEEFELVLVRYACERFLYRLGASELRGRFTLKGAGLLTLWMPDPYRATRDVDLLASGSPDETAVRRSMETICRVPCPEDGLVFDLDSLSLAPIREEQKYAGLRAVMRTHLGKAKIRLQVDFGFGDVLSVPAEEASLSTLIDRVPAPRLLAYPRVASVAEKLQAMVQRGRGNSRMKDFHDIWALTEALVFDGAPLREAIVQCFARRNTAWTPEVPDALTPAFYEDPDVGARWEAYLRRSLFRTPPPRAIQEVGDRIREFFGPLRESILARAAFERYWPAGGPWRSETSAR